MGLFRHEASVPRASCVVNLLVVALYIATDFDDKLLRASNFVYQWILKKLSLSSLTSSITSPVGQ